MKKGEVKNPQVPSEHYYRAGYDTKGRFASYWHQIDEIQSLANGDILEVGPGNKFVSDYLRKRGYSITTMDIDPQLNVDIIGSVDDIPCEDNSFSVISCFEVLEHVPYPKALQSLREMKRASGQHVIFSVPDQNHAYWLRIRLPFIGEVSWNLSLERPIPLEKPAVEDQHFWEIGVQNYSLRRLKNDIKNIGFKISKTYRVPQNERHRLFVLSA